MFTPLINQQISNYLYGWKLPCLFSWYLIRKNRFQRSLKDKIGKCDGDWSMCTTIRKYINISINYLCNFSLASLIFSPFSFFALTGFVMKQRWCLLLKVFNGLSIFVVFVIASIEADEGGIPMVKLY